MFPRSLANQKEEATFANQPLTPRHVDSAEPLPRNSYAIFVFGASFSLDAPKNTSYQHKKQ